MIKQTPENSLSFDLSQGEFWFLLQQFGPTVMLGIANPYLGWLIDEIKDADRDAIRSLVDRDLVRIVSGNQIEVDDALAMMVNVCAHSEHTLIAQYRVAGKKVKQSYYHFRNGAIIKQLEVKRGKYQLSAIKDRDTFISDLDTIARLSLCPTGNGSKFHLPEQILFSVRALCSRGQSRKALNLLQKEKVSADNSKMLTKALTYPVANTVFVTLINQGQPETRHVKGFAILESKTEFWVLQPFEKKDGKMVEFIPANARLARRRLLEILPPEG